ncbi:hypothetical protein ACJJTC_002643 [Scirpophaga incertulas]
MAYNLIFIFTLVLSVISSFAVQVPVFSWGDLSKTSIKSNPLTKVSADEFGYILKEELKKDPFTVIFIEETLSVEDFSLKNANGETSFPYLRANIGDSLYLPTVEHALHVLNKLADPEKVDHVKLTENGLSADIEPDSGNFLFINLKDAREDESRSDLLRRHNDFMEDMFLKLQERYDSVVAVYTAHYPSWTIPAAHSRVRRQAATTSTHEHVLDGLRLYAGKILFSEDGNTADVGDLAKSSSEFNSTVMNTTISFSNIPSASFSLNFRMEMGYWFFDSITLQNGSIVEELPATSDVYAIEGFSYRCGQNVTFNSVNDTSTPFKLTFVDLKVQPFFKTMNESDMAFGDSFNCVGFFSVPIWSGLFVVFVLLAITFYGIMMMMDIRTMDRFDDPKGKTITINAAE